MNTNIKNIFPYLIMCAVLTGMAIWAKSNERQRNAALLVEMEQQWVSLGLAGEEAAIIDLRSPAEFREGHLKGAFNIPGDSLGAGMLPLPLANRDFPVVLYCRDGKCAERVAVQLVEHGFTRVVNLNAAKRRDD